MYAERCQVCVYLSPPDNNICSQSVKLPDLSHISQLMWPRDLHVLRLHQSTLYTAIRGPVVYLTNTANTARRILGISCYFDYEFAHYVLGLMHEYGHKLQPVAISLILWLNPNLPIWLSNKKWNGEDLPKCNLYF